MSIPCLYQFIKAYHLENCLNCKTDEFNMKCKDYKPINLFNVKGDDMIYPFYQSKIFTYAYDEQKNFYRSHDQKDWEKIGAVDLLVNLDFSQSLNWFVEGILKGWLKRKDDDENTYWLNKKK